MHLRHHFLVAGAISLLIYFQTGLTNALIVLAFGVLVDADHYLYYIFKFKSFNFKEAMKYFKGLKDASHLLLPLHWIEWFIPLFILARYFEVAWYALLGFAIHISLDLLQTKFLKSDGRNLSFFQWYMKNRFKKP